MNCCGAIVVLVCAGLVSRINAAMFENIERYWTASPSNSVLYTPNQSETVQTIEFKKTITKDSPLLLTADLIDKNTGNILFSEKDLNICENYDRASFKYVAVRLFDRALIPGPRKRKCPVDKQQYEIQRYQFDLTTDLSVSPGSYDISYTAKSNEGELVFSTLKFKFSVVEPYSFG